MLLPKNRVHLRINPNRVTVNNLHMKIGPFSKLIVFDDFSATPKYQQLADSFIRAIENKKLQLNDMVPSINEVSSYFEISRDTVEKGYRTLKKQGILGSVPGKGYFIKSVETGRSLRIFLMFNKLSTHKKILYDSLIKALDNKATIDFYIYHSDLGLFRRILEANKEKEYDYYVIVPHFTGEGDDAYDLLNTIPQGKLVLLDKMVRQVQSPFAVVYENFGHDIFNALREALPQLEKYPRLKIIFPPNSYYPIEILEGFINFCTEYAFSYRVVTDIESEELKKGEVYINLMDDDLVTLVEKAVAAGFQVGEEIGIISYNETPLKRIILQGITTISTNFEVMGSETARVIIERSPEQVQVPFTLNLRASL